MADPCVHVLSGLGSVDCNIPLSGLFVYFVLDVSLRREVWFQGNTSAIRGFLHV
jgi:hypothetical protein